MRRLLAIAAGFLLLAAAFGTYYKLKPLSAGDPDRYYHIALSRLTVEQGKFFLHSLPQVEDLGWGDNFLDKEFLFHQATTLGYAIAGERGVVEASFLCAILSLLALYLFAASQLPVPAAFGITALTFSNPYLMYRMTLLRPHTLAVLTFLLMNIALLSRRPRLTAAATFLFVLSYHAFYVPLVCMALVFGLSFLDAAEERVGWRKTALMGVFGCVAGLLANPYFPGNLVLAAIHARIPDLMKGELHGVPFGEELVPVKADGHFMLFSGTMLVLAVAILCLGVDLHRRDSEAKKTRVKLLYLLGVGGFFFAVSFQIARAGEYLVPACGLIIVLLVDRWRAHLRVVTAAVILLALAQWGKDIHLYQTQVSKNESDRVNESLRAVAAIPAEPKGAKVFNCEWDRTPYIFYVRPDLRFIDVLDPSLLYFANPGAFRGREELRNGTVADAYGLVRKAFHADYVFCNDPNMSAQIRSEPGFQQIYPKFQNPGQSLAVPTVFRVLPEGPKEFALTLAVSEPQKLDEGARGGLTPPPAGAHRKELDLERSPYLNLGAFLPPKKESGPYLCVFVSPGAEEVKRLAGATYLGLGGGPGLQAWQNGRALFTTRVGFPNSRSIQVLVPLASPLRPNDRLDVLSCSLAGSSFWGIAISLWTEAGIKVACEQKNAGLTPSTMDPLLWPYQGLQALTCLAPIAAPSANRQLSHAAVPSQSRNKSRP